MSRRANSLTSLIRPQSVALVGASSAMGKFGGKVAANLHRSALDDVFLVSRSEGSIRGRPTYSSLAELPHPADCVLLAVPAAACVEQLAQAAEAGTRSAVVFAGGFGEANAEGMRLQATLIDIATSHSMSILGPNCVGLYNAVDRIFSTSIDDAARAHRSEGSVALLAQSGSLGIIVASMPSGCFRHVVTTGNEAVTTVADIMDFLIDDDPQTEVFVLVMESIRDVESLARVAHKATAQGKKVVLLKMATGKAASNVASLHTGAVSGERAPIQAFCEAHQIVLVDDLRDLVATVTLLGTSTYREGRRVGIYTSSGGSAVLGAGCAEREGLLLPEPTPEVIGPISSTLDLDVHRVRNPLDTTGFAAFDSLRFGQGLQQFAAGGFDLVVVPLSGAGGDEAVNRVDAVIAAAKASPTPIAAVWQQLALIGQPAYEKLVASGISVFTDYESPLRAMSLLSGPPAEGSGAGHPSSQSLPDEGQLRGFVEILGDLEQAGLTVAKARRIAPVTTEEDLAKLAVNYPVALKVSHPRLVHKSDAGLVRFPVHSPADAVTTIREMTRTADGLGLVDFDVVVQEAVPRGFELLCGFGHDVEVGSYGVIAAGGIYTEIMSDSTTFLLRPVDSLEETIRRSLRTLKSWPILQGARGQAGFDVEAVIAATAAMARYFLSVPEAKGMEINPLIVSTHSGGATLVDARMV